MTLELVTFKIGSQHEKDLYEQGYAVWKITAKDNPAHPFSPTWKLVNAYRRGEIDEHLYTANYYRLLHNRWPEVEKVIRRMLKDDKKIALGCYCKPGEFCHRRIVAELILASATMMGKSAVWTERR